LRTRAQRRGHARAGCATRRAYWRLNPIGPTRPAQAAESAQPIQWPRLSTLAVRSTCSAACPLEGTDLLCVAFDLEHKLRCDAHGRNVLGRSPMLHRKQYRRSMATHRIQQNTQSSRAGWLQRAFTGGRDHCSSAERARDMSNSATC
jgi:hypothetical protein